MEYRSAILIVDDQAVGRMALEGLLAQEGYHLSFASDGPQALAQALRDPPDLVLLDVMMPGMDGFEVCRRLRAAAQTAEIAVIMVTALDDRAALVQGIEAGADDFISKPFNRAELRARVRTITRLNRYRRLWESRDRYAQLVDHSPNGIVILDPSGTMLMTNPAFRTLLQLAANDAPGDSIYEVVPTHRRAALASMIADLTAYRLSHGGQETILITRSGIRRPVALDAGRCSWDSAPAIQVIVRDIGAQKRAELLDLERRRFVYDLHDGAAQLVSGLYQHLQLYVRRHRPRNPQARSALAHLEAIAQQATHEIRRLLEGLRPGALDDFGLAGALHMLAEAMRNDGWAITVEIALDEQALAPALEAALFRIAQEALTNSSKYAGTPRAAVRLSSDAANVQLVVQDWGSGFAPGERFAPGGGRQLGLRAMRDRAEILGGEVHLLSAPGQGVTIIAVIPRNGPALAEAGDAW